MPERFRLLIEGWRFIPHSFACVNMWQCLELLRRPGYRIHHNDQPFCLPQWRQVPGLFEPESEELLRDIPPLSASQADAVARFDFPYRFDPAAAGSPLVVFATTEFGLMPPNYLRGSISLAEAHAASGAVIVTPSEWARQGILRSGADPERVVIVPHGIDPALYRPASADLREELRRSLDWSENFVFLSVGSMQEQKGIRFLLKGFAAVAERFPQARLCLKGADDLYHSRVILEKSASHLTRAEQQLVQSRLIYIGGSLPFRDVVRLYQAADAYVSPYLSEGFNLPVLEAAACGLPVICTDGGATDDFTTGAFCRRIDSTLAIAADGSMGRWPDVEHLTALMAGMVEDGNFVEQARREGPRHAVEHFTWGHAVDKLLQVIHGWGR